MVEPFAAVIRNSWFPVRFALQNTSSSITSATKAMTGPSSTLTDQYPLFLSNHFGPNPRPIKGKQKAVEEPYSRRVLQCREWSCGPTRHFTPCTNFGLEYLLQELLPPHERPSCRYHSTRIPFSSRNKHRRFRSHTSGSAHEGGQRRHVSHATKSAPTISDATRPEPSSSIPRAQSRQDIVHQLQIMLETPLNAFNLDAAWSIYTAAVDNSCLDIALPETLLKFSEKMCEKIENFYEDEKQFSSLRKWRGHFSELLETLLRHFEKLEGHEEHFDDDLNRTLKCLHARSHALFGKTEDAVHILNHLRQAQPKAHAEIARAYESIYASIFYYHDALHVLDFLDRHLPVEYFSLPYCHWFRDPAASTSIYKRHHRLLSILATFRNPAPLFRHAQQRSAQWSTIGGILILSYCEYGLARLAFRVYEAMKESKLPMQDLLKLRLVRALARANAFDYASEVFSTVTEDAPEYFATGMHLFALQGDPKTVFDYYNDKRSSKDKSNNRFMLLYSYAIQGKTDQFRRLFNTLYPRDADGNFITVPSVVDFAIAVFAHTRYFDADGMGYWLRLMAKCGVQPNAHVYSSVIQCHMQSGNLDAIGDILGQMRKAGIAPNAVVYTNILTALSRRHNPRMVERVFRRALREGVKPDQGMIGALLNAYVESGAWDDVISFFKSLESNRKSTIHITIEIYNLILKAYVLMGAPFRVVATLFEKLDNDPRVSPTDITFSLILQSACDSGHMNTAMDIFREMERRSRRGAKSLMNAYVFTILMAGFLRKGMEKEAMEIYEDMVMRGINPTSVTFNVVLTYYANDRSEDSLRLAYEFMSQAVSQKQSASAVDEGDTYQPAVQTLYEPVLRGHAARGNTEGFEQLLDEMLDAGGQMTVPVLTSLLNLYRQKEQVDSARKVWEHLLDVGMQSVRLGESMRDKEDSNAELRTEVLCAPLSVYLDTLSFAGQHEEVLQTWQEYRQKGFSFNFFNWNRLGMYLIRAGMYERAFEVLDRIIIPYIRQILRDRPGHTSPDSAEEQDKEDEFPAPYEILNRTSLSFLDCLVGPFQPKRGIRRARVVEWNSAKATPESVAMSFSAEDNEDIPEFVRPLGIYAYSGKNAPRPHWSLMNILLIGYQRLRAGQPAIPSVNPGGSEDMDYIPTVEEEDRAREQLRYIDTEFPDAVQAVLEFQAVEQQRLGEHYKIGYVWG